MGNGKGISISRIKGHLDKTHHPIRQVVDEQDSLVTRLLTHVQLARLCHPCIDCIISYAYLCTFLIDFLSSSVCADYRCLLAADLCWALVHLLWVVEGRETSESILTSQHKLRKSTRSEPGREEYSFDESSPIWSGTTNTPRSHDRYPGGSSVVRMDTHCSEIWSVSMSSNNVVDGLLAAS